MGKRMPPEYHANYYSEHSEALRKQMRLRYQSRKEEYWARGLQTKYGLSMAAYNEMLMAQGHACAVCELPAQNHHTRLHVDHDHETGRIRGLLCSRCNTAIGLLDDNIDTLARATAYLKGCW